MIYVGADIAKLNHFASAISSDGEVLISRLNLQMTLMASKCWSRSSFRLTQSPTASSSVLNQRHTMATTLFDTLSLKISRCVEPHQVTDSTENSAYSLC